MEKSLDQFAMLFVVVGIFGAGGLALIGFQNAADINAPSWPFFAAAIAVAVQCGWLYTLSKALSELLRRSNSTQA